MTTTQQLMTRVEVAAMLKVVPVTVTRWATTGRLASIRTPGGQHRFDAAYIEMMIASLHNSADVQP